MQPAKLAALGAALVSTAAAAAPLELIYDGAFGTADAFGPASAASPTPFAGTTPFTLRARFDGSAPNLVAALPFPGFNAIAPEQVTISFAGTTYRVAGAGEDPTAGVAVALFDPSNVFFPGRYGVGVIADPVRDGAGIVGDWSAASPAFSAGSPVATELLGYNGAGFSAGVGCVVGPGPCVVTPLALFDPSGQRFGLVLGSREEQFNEGAPLNTARVVAAAAVPLPGTLALLGAGGVLLSAGRARRAKPAAAEPA